MHYRSSIQLLGLPLVEIALGGGGVPPRRGARGWIAIGDVAFGILFAGGGVAVGGVAMGGAAVGLLSLGGGSLGGLAMGGLAVGVAAVGGGAFGLWGAVGGLALAGEVALGGLAIAPHANDAVARAALASGPLRLATRLLAESRWLVLLALVPALAGLIRLVRARGVERPGRGPR